MKSLYLAPCLNVCPYHIEDSCLQNKICQNCQLLERWVLGDYSYITKEDMIKTETKYQQKIVYGRTYYQAKKTERKAYYHNVAKPRKKQRKMMSESARRLLTNLQKQ